MNIALELGRSKFASVAAKQQACWAHSRHSLLSVAARDEAGIPDFDFTQDIHMEIAPLTARAKPHTTGLLLRNLT